MPFTGWNGFGNTVLSNGDAVMDCEITRCAQFVDFSRPYSPGCWATDKGLETHGLSCGGPSTGRLGLCAEHEVEILGEKGT